MQTYAALAWLGAYLHQPGTWEGYVRTSPSQSTEQNPLDLVLAALLCCLPARRRYRAPFVEYEQNDC